VIKATRIVYEKYKKYLGTENRSVIESIFKSAEKLWLQATCSDSTGLTPRAIERITAEQNVLTAQKKCAQILQIIADNVAELNVTKLQVDLMSEKVYTNESNFISLINVVERGLSLFDLPLNVEVTYNVENQFVMDPLITVSRATYNLPDGSISDDSFKLFMLDVVFEGTHDWADDSVQSINIRFRSTYNNSAFRDIIYSPSLLENETKKIYRDNYFHDPVYIFLPLSNGMIFIPDNKYGARGIALVKDIEKRHTSWLWDSDYIEIFETNGLHLDAHHRIYILENVTIDMALKFANRVNLHPPWIVSKDVSLIQGNEVYTDYEKMQNKLA